MQLFRALKNYPGDRLLIFGPSPASDAELLPCRYEPLSLLTYRLACTRFRGWTSGLNALNTLIEPQLSRSLKLAREFGPDVVITVMDKLSYYKHAWAMAGRLSVPLMTITMDDPQTFERAHPTLDWAFVRFLRRIYRDASLSLGVSPEMCEYLEEKFGRKSEVFYFGPPDCIRHRLIDDSRMLKSPPSLTLGYAGSLSLGYREGLNAIMNTLEITGTNLKLYTRDQHIVPEHPRITNRGYFPAEELWPIVQEECDAVILPYAFEGPITRVYRTHFPTKLSEYLWLGMPILVSGPQYATGVRWALRHPEATRAVTSPEKAVLGPVLEEIKADASLRVNLALRSTEIGRSSFDPLSIRKQFADLVCATANSSLNRPCS
jgi:hypothetical protein